MSDARRVTFNTHHLTLLIDTVRVRINMLNYWRDSLTVTKEMKMGFYYEVVHLRQLEARLEKALGKE